MDVGSEASRKLFQEATTSNERFAILELAVAPGTFSIAEGAREIERTWGTAQGHVNALVDAGLVGVDATQHDYAATPLGRRVHDCVAAGVADAVMLRHLDGHRVVAVRIPSHRDPAHIVKAMRRDAVAICLVDGDYDLICLLPDDTSLVKSLGARAHRMGAEKVSLSRIARVLQPGDAEPPTQPVSLRKRRQTDA